MDHSHGGNRKLFNGQEYRGHTETVPAVWHFDQGHRVTPYPFGGFSTPDLLVHGAWDGERFYDEVYIEVKGYEVDKASMAEVHRNFTQVHGGGSLDRTLFLVLAPPGKQGAWASRGDNRERPWLRRLDLVSGLYYPRVYAPNRDGLLRLVHWGSPEERPRREQPFYGRACWRDPRITPASRKGEPNAPRT